MQMKSFCITFHLIYKWAYTKSKSSSPALNFQRRKILSTPMEKFRRCECAFLFEIPGKLPWEGQK